MVWIVAAVVTVLMVGVVIGFGLGVIWMGKLITFLVDRQP